MFWSFAVFGTLFFFLKVAAMVFGGLGAEDFDADSDIVDAEIVEDGLHGSHDSPSDAAFKLLSVHAVTGFCMMFGWTGLTVYKQFGLGAPVSFLAASAAGVTMMYATAWLFKLASHMTSPGAAFSLKDVVGNEATVYMKIPEGGRGKVRLGVDGLTRFVEAVSDDGAAIDSFKVVQITRALDGSTVGVRNKD